MSGALVAFRPPVHPCVILNTGPQMSNSADTVNAHGDRQGEDAQRRRSEAVIKKAFVASGIAVQNLGVSHRFLPGMWMSVVNVLIECLDVADVVKLLTSRANVLGHGSENRNAPPENMAPQKLKKYLEEVVEAAHAVNKCVEEAMPVLEKEGLESRLPEAMLDTAVFLLEKSWGPDHLRRAMVEQASAFLTGTVAPIAFMEPKVMLRKAEAEHVTAAAEEPVEPWRPMRREKAIRIFLDYALGDEGAKWAAVIHKAAPDGTEELHTITGRCGDVNGRTAPLLAAIEALKAIQHEAPTSDTAFETSNVTAFRGMEGDGDDRKAFRGAAEGSFWTEFDALCDGRSLRYRHVARNLGDFAQHACDMAIKIGVTKIV